MVALTRHRTKGTLKLLLCGVWLGGSPAAPAPDIELVGLDGTSYNASQYLGSVLVLEWLNPNCPFSRRHAVEGTMQELADAHPEAVWLGVNSTSPGHGDHLEPAAHLAVNAELGIGYPVLLDPTGEAAAAYGAEMTPYLVVIDPAGEIVSEGAIDDDAMGALDPDGRENFVAEALADLEAGQPVATPSAPAYGCPIARSP